MTPRSSEQFELIREKSKTNITHCALQLFCERGYAHTTIEAIAQAAGVSKGLVYNYYTNKEELLIGSVLAGFEHMEQEMAALPNDPGPQIITFIDRMFETFSQHTDFWRLQMNIMMQPGIPIKLKSIIIEKLRLYIGLFTHTFKNAGLPQPEGEAWLLAASLDGAMLYYLFDEKNCPLHAMRDIMLRRYDQLLHQPPHQGA